jgi:hypothetical protein
MLLSGDLKFIYLVVLQKSLARTVILCIPAGIKAKALTRQLYIAKYVLYEFRKQLSSVNTSSLVHKSKTDKFRCFYFVHSVQQCDMYLCIQLSAHKM